MTVIGLDIGTTSISINWMDQESGRILRSATLPNRSGLAKQNTYSDCQDPDIIYEIVKSALESFPSEVPPSCIGITGQMHGILYLDADGKALSPLYTWRDGSGNEPCPLTEYTQSYAAYLSEITGYPMASGYGCTTYFVHLVNRSVPAGATVFCSIQDYVAMRLVGAKRPLVHISNAASFGLFDLKQLSFDRQAMERAGLDQTLLPEITAQNAILGRYQGRIPVSVAIGDNQASFLGSVGNLEQSVLVNIGTGSQITFATRSVISIPGLELRPCLETCLIQVGSSLCGGRSLALLEQFFRRTTELVMQHPTESAYPGIDACLANCVGQRGDCSLKISTKFCGTREHPEERGYIRNIGMDNFTPENLVFGFLRGMASELLELYERAELRHPILVGAGNGLRKNPFLQQVIADAFGLELRIPVHEEEAAYGAALFALTCSGFCRDIGEAQEKICYERAGTGKREEIN